MNTTQSPNNQESAERRIWSRFPGNGASVTICYDAGQQDAEVLDNSFAGIGLSVADISALHQGQRVAVAYKGEKVSAIVNRIEPKENGAHVVALEWLYKQGILRKLLNAVLHRGAADSSEVR